MSEFERLIPEDERFEIDHKQRLVQLSTKCTALRLRFLRVLETDWVSEEQQIIVEASVALFEFVLDQIPSEDVRFEEIKIHQRVIDESETICDLITDCLRLFDDNTDDPSYWVSISKVMRDLSLESTREIEFLLPGLSLMTGFPGIFSIIFGVLKGGAGIAVGAVFSALAVLLMSVYGGLRCRNSVDFYSIVSQAKKLCNLSTIPKEKLPEALSKIVTILKRFSYVFTPCPICEICTSLSERGSTSCECKFSICRTCFEGLRNGEDDLRPCPQCFERVTFQPLLG